MRRHLTAASAAVLLLALPPAPAAALEADALKQVLEDYVEELRIALPDGDLRMGEIEIVEESGGLRVLIPDVVLDRALEGETLEVGDLSFLVAEAEAGVYAFSEVTVPERLVLLGRRGEDLGSLTFDLQRLSGRFDADLGELLGLDLLLRGLELRIPAEGALVGLAELSGSIVTEPEAERPGRHRQLQEYRAAGLVISDPEATVEFGEITGSALIEGLDLEVYRTFSAIFADLQTAADQGDGKRIEALRQAMGEISHLAVALDQTARFDGLVVHDGAGVEMLRLDEMELSLEADAPLEGDVGSAALLFAGSGFLAGPALGAEADALSQLIPTDWRLPLRIEKLPLEDLSDLTIDLLFEHSLDRFSGFPEMSGGQALLAALGQAGTRLVVRDLFVEAPLGRTEAKASLTFAPETPLGVVGMVEFVATGLDRILVYAEGLEDPETKRWLSAAVLGMMGVGEAVALQDGSVGYRYSFWFTPDGEVSMNGFGFGDMLNEAIPQ